MPKCSQCLVDSNLFFNSLCRTYGLASANQKILLKWGAKDVTGGAKDTSKHGTDLPLQKKLNPIKTINNNEKGVQNLRVMI